MARIIPAILTNRRPELERLVRRAEGFAPYVQFDIMDGIFVTSRSVGAADIRAVQPRFAWEAHLMVRNPADYLAEFKSAGAARVIFHAEAAGSPRDTIAAARQLGMKVGIALNPGTPVDLVLRLADGLDSVLFMTVNPGFYGSRFLPEVLHKIADFHRHCPGVPVGADGGARPENIRQFVAAGVSDIYVGSAIFHSGDPAASFRELQALADAAR